MEPKDVVLSVLGGFDDQTQDVPPWIPYLHFSESLQDKLTPESIDATIDELIGLGLIERRGHADAVYDDFIRAGAMVSRQMVKFFSRHLVGLAVDEASISGPGSPPAVMSGFILEVGSLWLWVTAGHCIEEVKKLHQADDTPRSRFMDGFGETATGDEGLPVDLSLCAPFSLYDDETGVDIGFMVLHDLYRDGMIANGVVPMKFST